MFGAGAATSWLRQIPKIALTSRLLQDSRVASWSDTTRQRPHRVGLRHSDACTTYSTDAQGLHRAAPRHASFIPSIGR
jgi:hypothetical protein